jgi:hypothetical protein
MRLAVLVAFAALVLAAGSPAAPSSGIQGLVLRGPVTPVCRAESPCSAPAAHVLVRVWRGQRLVSSAWTDAQGRFRLGLSPALYTVSIRFQRGPTWRVSSQRVHVVSREFARVRFVLDTGIR